MMYEMLVALVPAMTLVALSVVLFAIKEGISHPTTSFKRWAGMLLLKYASLGIGSYGFVLAGSVAPAAYLPLAWIACAASFTFTVAVVIGVKIYRTRD